MSPPVPAPDVCVVLVVGPHRRRGARALASVLSQEGASFEVAYFDTEEGRAPPLAGSDDPRVRPLPAKGHGLAACRARGGLAARAPVVAYIEEHCEARPGWLAAVRGAFEGGPWVGVGVSFENGNAGLGFSDTAMLLNYGQYMPPVVKGAVPAIAGHNSAFRADVLRENAAELEGLLENELVLNERLRREGRRLYLAPEGVIAHWNESSMGLFLRGHWHFNRGLAATRVRYHRWSLARRALRVALSPLAPWLRLAEQLVRDARRGGGALGATLRQLPAIVVYHATCVLAQTLGYALGPGAAYERMSDYELTADRPDAEPRA